MYSETDKRTRLWNFIILALSLSLVLVFSPGCKKKSESGESGDTKSAAKSGGGKAKAGSTPKETFELYNDYWKNGHKSEAFSLLTPESQKKVNKEEFMYVQTGISAIEDSLEVCEYESDYIEEEKAAVFYIRRVPDMFKLMDDADGDVKVATDMLKSGDYYELEHPDQVICFRKIDGKWYVDLATKCREWAFEE